MRGGGNNDAINVTFSKSQILDRDYGYVVEKLCLRERERERKTTSQKEKILKILIVFFFNFNYT